MTNPDNPDLSKITPVIQSMLDANGVTLEQLVEHLATLPDSTPTDSAPTKGTQGERSSIRAFVAAAEEALPPGSVKTYRTYWRVLSDGIRLPASWTRERIDTYAADLATADRSQKLALDLPTDIHACPRDGQGRLVVRAGHGDKQLREVGEFEIRILAKWVGAHARAKAAEQDRVRETRGRPVTHATGKGAQENFIGAVRCLYKAAEGNGVVPAGHAPAKSIAKPARRTGTSRRPQTDAELRDIWVTCSTTGNDPELDSLIVRLQLETASRQEGCINLVMGHLDDDQQSVWLDQKNDELKDFPVTDALLRDLRAFGVARGASGPGDYVLRQKVRHRRTGEQYPPLTSRRFDQIHERAREQHPWANLASWSSHWLRHHAAARIEGIGGRPCKMRLLNHKPNGQTDGYGQATFEQLAWAHAVMMGEPHPLAQRPPWIFG